MVDHGKGSRVGQFGSRRDQCYAILRRPEVEASNAIIRYIIPVFPHFISMLFDLTPMCLHIILLVLIMGRSFLLCLLMFLP